MSLLYKNILLSSLVVFFSTYSQIILRMRLNQLASSFFNENRNFQSLLVVATDFWVVSSIAAFFLAFVCWSVVLTSDFNITKTYPIVTSLTILFVSVVNFMLFQDKIDYTNILGGLIVVLGIFLLLR